MSHALPDLLPWPVDQVIQCNMNHPTPEFSPVRPVALFCPTVSIAKHVLQADTESDLTCSEAIYVVPAQACEQLPELTSALVRHCSATLDISDSDESEYAILYAPSHAPNGTIASATLPDQLRNLHPANEDYITFMFESVVAGVAAHAMFDSGATHNFIDTEFAARHHLSIRPDPLEVRLANGSVVNSPGTVTAALRLQRYSTTITCRVMPLVSDVEVVLGSSWAQRNRVVADFSKPCLHIRPTSKTLHEPITIFPGREKSLHDTFPAQPISAACAARLLKRPRHGCAPAFFVLIRDAKSASATAPADAEGADPELDSLLHEFSDLFETPEGTQQHLHITAEAVPLEGNNSPPNRPAFRLCLSERKEIERRVKEMLAKGWIQTSHSGYGAPVLFVPKPDGALRMCIDYRALNKITKSNKYPLPRIDDLMDTLSGARCFSALDLTDGYYQLALQPEDVPKTAFNTHIGKYEWKVLPMGLKNAPSVFQAVMNQLFAPLLHKCVCVYLDDLLVYSRTKEEHYKHLRDVFALLRKHSLRIKTSKCEFFKSQLKFLGHILSSDGLNPDPKKVQVVTDWTTPKSVQDVRSFLGLANYFRKYIQGYAKLAAPLTNLLKCLDPGESIKGRRLRRLQPDRRAAIEANFAVKWSAACQQAFEGLKVALTSAPVLRLPDFDKPFEMVADACTSTPAIGAVLLQEGRPVAFYSRKCNDREGNYCASDLEMLGVIAALKEWRPYLQGGLRFKIVTDHLPNTYVDSATVTSHTLQRRARWLEIASSYDYEWEYRPGRLNVADPISRAPAHFHCALAATAVLQVLTDKPALAGQLTSRSLTSSSGARLRSALPVRAAWLCALCAAVTRSEVRDVPARPAPSLPPPPFLPPPAPMPPPPPLVGGDDAPAQGDSAQGDSAEDTDNAHGDILELPGTATDKEHLEQFSIENFYARIQAGCEAETPPATTTFRSTTCLYYNGDQLYIPAHDKLRRECFEASHSHLWSGHFGVRKTLKRLQTAYWWPNMQQDVEDWIRHCDCCQRNKFQRIAPPGKLQPLEIPKKPWTEISMDWITCLPRTEAGYDAILVVVDRLSKLTHFIPCNSSDGALASAKHFQREIVRLHGLPESIVSDRDPRLTAKFWAELMKLLQVRQKLSTARHPQTDGQTENMNQQLEDFLRHYIGPLQNDWDTLLPAAEFAINNSFHSSTGATPFQLTYGYTPRSPATAHLEPATQTITVPGLAEFRSKWFDEIKRAQKCLRVAQDRQKAAADRKRSDTPAYKQGDQVLLKTPPMRLRKHLVKKLSPRWIGPFAVDKVIGDSKSAVKLVLPKNLKLHPVFHVSQLRPYYSDGTYQPPPPVLYVEGEPLWQVETLLDHQLRGKQHHYKVLWEGYDEPTWEPLKNLDQCEDAIKEYWEAKGHPVPHRLRYA